MCVAACAWLSGFEDLWCCGSVSESGKTLHSSGVGYEDTNITPTEDDMGSQRNKSQTGPQPCSAEYKLCVPTCRCLVVCF